MRLFLIIGLFLIFVDLALAHQVIRGSHVKGRVKLVFASLTAHFQVQANARHRFTVSHSSFRQFRIFTFRHALDPLRQWTLLDLAHKLSVREPCVKLVALLN